MSTIIIPLSLRSAYTDLHRAYPLIMDRAWPYHERVHDALAHNHVSQRCLEVLEAVENERVVGRNPVARLRRRRKHSHSQRSSGAASNAVVQHDGALGVAPDIDPGAV